MTVYSILKWVHALIHHREDGYGYYAVNGIVHIRSHYSVHETLQRLESVLLAHGLTIFGRVDHSGEAD